MTHMIPYEVKLFAHFELIKTYTDTTRIMLSSSILLNPGTSRPDQMVSERLKTNFTNIQIEPAIFPLSHKLRIFRELFGDSILILKF